ncbi:MULTISPECIES: Cfr10I/Bse634I family restriction endonuclease [Vibrio harveyi group]|uniref:Cfr10I/Bse634I family restriction endonuclease n=1 Tax=Vibrio harveyi group TaxID=717610 RepID=UPI00112108FA|nr:MULTISPECIES: Cfr10I/Bse634I family restriction endonuclease [Vibrio harveyi group]EGQ8307664.1 restriction endonuclease [Vibrio parahaemolyticus]EGR2938677.1 restriction endonuclease [Vibrio parahaemolyticus]EGR3275141.1 restriction endonuclease [Vibrio parahaemolyticus]EGR3309616.1 restriction endonuclease [Vibrio parahaemolyticus]EJG0166504.1 Cfr10I/Bse634I family restriction endonuclease [Vibrio parahaemolyticus]
MKLAGLTTDSKGKSKTEIHSLEAFRFSIPNALAKNDRFKDILNAIETDVTSYCKQHKLPHPAQGSFNNCRGRWYEWLFMIYMWNHFVTKGSTIRPLPLPNSNHFQFTKLYNNELYGYLADLEDKLLLNHQVRLVTSSPDYVLIDIKDLSLPDPLLSSTFDPEDFSDDVKSYLDELYKTFIGKCDLNTIRGFISIKTSVRSDRRFQWLHEGNLAKSLYQHLRTRRWDIDAKGIKFYGFTSEMKDADRNALMTATTHTIASIGLQPERSVDKPFLILGKSDLEQALHEISQEM